MVERSGRWMVTLGETVFIVVVLFFGAGVLLPALHRIASMPYGPRCGINLAGIGKAMLIYANDYDDQLPCAGGPDASWAARTPNWMAQDRFEAYGIAPNSQLGGQARMSASLYLLVKYAEVEPKVFVCSQDKGVREFKLAKVRGLPKGFESIDAWDFGPEPPKHVSFAYHMSYGSYNLATCGTPGMAVAAERNPWMASPFSKARDFSKFQPDIPPFDGTMEAARQGNAIAHKGDGQNVLFLDSHVEFAKRSFCSLDGDNIYTSWKDDDKARGNPAKSGSAPAHRNDSLLVNDPAVVAEP